jgi:hypothetical protein
VNKVLGNIKYKPRKFFFLFPGIYFRFIFVLKNLIDGDNTVGIHTFYYIDLHSNPSFALLRLIMLDTFVDYILPLELIKLNFFPENGKNMPPGGQNTG